MIPMNTDICVCTDMDEIFVTGWRRELEYIKRAIELNPTDKRLLNNLIIINLLLYFVSYIL